MNFKIYSKPIDRVFHASIGSVPIPVEEFDAHAKHYIKEHRKVIAKFLVAIRKLGFKFQGIGVLDYSYDPEKRTIYIHTHFALLGERNLHCSAGIFNAVISKVTGNKIKIVKCIGYRNWFYADENRPANMLYYFAKKMAGIFGHKNKRVYGFEDFINKEDYFAQLYNVRSLTKIGISEGLTCKVGRIASPECSICGAKMRVFMIISADDPEALQKYLSDGGSGA